MTQDSEISELKNTSLTLYAFYLRNSIDRGFENTVPEASRIWEKITDLGNTRHISELQNLYSKLICYETNQYHPEIEDRQLTDYFPLLKNPDESLDFSLLSEPELEIRATLSPYRYHDSYLIDLNLYSENSINPTQLKKFNSQYQLFSPLLENYLGKTLFFYAEVSNSQSDYSDLAKTCASQLFDVEKESIKLVSDRLFNCPLFIYDNGETNTHKQQHLIIWVNDRSIEYFEKQDKFYEWLSYLICSRHKILYAYDRSRSRYNDAKPYYEKIEQNINKFSENVRASDRLEKFKELLRELPELSLKYGQLVREIEDHKNTIKTNLQNYQRSNTELKELPDSNITFSEDFLTLINNKFIPQIEADLSFLTPIKSLFQELLNNIRSIVQIDQIESDRQLQEQLRIEAEKSEERANTIEGWIAFFGTGLAVSGVSAGVVSDPSQTIVKTLNINAPSFCQSDELAQFLCTNSFDVVFHLIVGLIVAIPAAIFIRLIPREQGTGNREQ
ncbi:MAG: hypothetical protein QNJ54_10745 [Prochloraceae cyanobacterium]|nr:hypothetical protein [Prochloraceae cyanobacterium]